MVRFEFLLGLPESPSPEASVVFDEAGVLWAVVCVPGVVDSESAEFGASSCGVSSIINLKPGSCGEGGDCPLRVDSATSNSGGTGHGREPRLRKYSDHQYGGILLQGGSLPMKRGYTSAA